MKFFFIVLGVFSIFFTLLPFVKSDKWWIRVFDYPRFQVLTMAMFSLAGILYLDHLDHFWEDYALISLVTLCLFYQFYTILPYTPLYTSQVEKSKGGKKNASVSVLIANVLMHNRSEAKLLEIVKSCDPDIFLAVETDTWWKNKLDVLIATYPNYISYPLENTYGMMLYSKLDLFDHEVRFLVDDSIPSIYTKIKLRNGDIISLYALHPTPPVPGENNKSTERDAELLIVGKEAKTSKLPVIVAGDLNDVAWSYTTKLFQKISGLLDPRIGRGLFNSFNAKYPLLRWPLDHVFHSNQFKVIKLERLSHFGSDHFPIYINLHLDHSAPLEQQEPNANGDEKAEAEEKIQKV